MKISFIKSTVVVILAALLPSATANSCIRQSNVLYTYIVKADGVKDIPGACGGLWDNLKRFPACVASKTTCSKKNGNLYWKFNVGKGCDGGMVESTWWEATRNKFGAINCP